MLYVIWGFFYAATCPGGQWQTYTCKRDEIIENVFIMDRSDLFTQKTDVTHTDWTTRCLNMDNVPVQIHSEKKNLGLVQLVFHPRTLSEPLRQAARALLSQTGVSVSVSASVRITEHTSPSAENPQPQETWRPSRRKCRCWSWIRRMR